VLPSSVDCFMMGAAFSVEYRETKLTNEQKDGHLQHYAYALHMCRVVKKYNSLIMIIPRARTW